MQKRCFASAARIRWRAGMCVKPRDLFFIGVLCLQFFVPLPAAAFPWNIDILRQPSYKSNELARPPALGSVPVGRPPFAMTTEEAARQVQNPELPGGPPLRAESLSRGERLWLANCAVCHGKLGDSETFVGKQIATPTLLDQLYRESTAGRVYGVLHNGGANMPRFGYRLSAEQIWELVQYVRKLQIEAAHRVAGEGR